MSTKACIARPDAASWWGYYVHTDGYPDHVGRVIVEMARARGVDAVWAHAATAPQGWTRFPDAPSIHHDEPFIISPEQDGGIEWLYVLEDAGGITVYRLNGWDDPDLRRLTLVGIINPHHPNALTDLMALTAVEVGVATVTPGRQRLRIWSEHSHDMSCPECWSRLAERRRVRDLLKVIPPEPTEDEIGSGLIDGEVSE